MRGKSHRSLNHVGIVCATRSLLASSIKHGPYANGGRSGVQLRSTRPNVWADRRIGMQHLTIVKTPFSYRMQYEIHVRDVSAVSRLPIRSTPPPRSCSRILEAQHDVASSARRYWRELYSPIGQKDALTSLFDDSRCQRRVPGTRNTGGSAYTSRALQIDCIDKTRCCTILRRASAARTFLRSHKYLHHISGGHWHLSLQ